MSNFKLTKQEDGRRCLNVAIDAKQHKAIKGYAWSQHITIQESVWQSIQFFLRFQLKYGTLSKNKPLSRREWTNVVDEIFTGKKF